MLLVGEIAEAGRGVTGFQPGERVAVYPIAVCGTCRYCRAGRHNLCEAEFGLDKTNEDKKKDPKFIAPCLPRCTA